MALKSIRTLLLSLIAVIVFSIGHATWSQADDSPTDASPAVEAADFKDDFDDSEFPLSEPNYTAKRVRDFRPFADALNHFSSERRRVLDQQLLEATVPEMQQLIACGHLTAEELALYYLDRIQRYDVDKFNAVMELNPDALDLARRRDKERAAGQSRGALHGIPLLLKDNIATGDQLHTTAGAYALKDWQANRDAFLVKQLRDAGAVILGKTNLSEWANYLDPLIPNGFSTLGGQTRHPYGSFDPFGSSTGSAVAVAANFIAVSVGSETQGSILFPAQSNGIVGLKTSRGLVSRDYIIPLVDWMDVPGPMGRTITDVATLLTAMTGVDTNDAATTDAAALAGTDFTQFLSLEAARRRRVGVPVLGEANLRELLEEDPSQESIEFLRQLVEASQQHAQTLTAPFRDMGIEIVAVEPTQIPTAPDANSVLEHGFKASLNAFLATTPGISVDSLDTIISLNNADPSNRIPYGQGYLEGAEHTEIDAETYAMLREINQSTSQSGLNQVFETTGIDVLISDGQAYAAAGFPALTVPSGLSPEGQPQGLTLIGKFLGEPDLLAVGYAYEAATQARVAPDLEAAIATFASANQATPGTN